MQSQGAFNQRPAFNQGSSNNVFGQTSFNPGAFNQTTSRGAFNQTTSRGAFNQPFGSRSVFGQANTQSTDPSNQSYNQYRNSSIFGQPKRSGGAFGQSNTHSADPAKQLPIFNRKVNTFGGGAFDQAIAQSAKASEQSSAPNLTFSAFNQPKRGGGRGAHNTTTRGKGREGVATAKRDGSNAGSISSSFQRKSSNNNNNSNRPAITNVTTSSNDASRTTVADRAIRFGGTSKTALYDQFKESRVRERQDAIERKLIPDPNKPTTLENAVDFRGTCQTKCPKFEMLEREIQNGLDNLEMDSQGNVDPEKAVKAYRRSAAGLDQPLPSDVRPPEVLIHTLDYLFDDILSNNVLENCHAFLRDRTRSIRQDFTLQNIRDIDAVHVHERIARFHIFCLHEMCELDEGKFVKQQEVEQLNKVLVSLMEFYDDLREEGIETENEAEFRAYNIISHIRDQDIARQSMTLPMYIFKSPYITRALEFRALSQRNNEIMESSSRRNKPENIEASQNFYSAFFKLIQDAGTPFLMACMLESHFADVRKGALKAMNVSYMMKAGGVQAEDVRRVLGYDTIKQLLEEASIYGIVIDNSLDEPTLCFGQKHYSAKLPFFIEPLSNPAQKKSLLLVEPKKAGRTYREIVNGINPNATPLPNQNVFAHQSNPIASYGGTFSFVPHQITVEKPHPVKTFQSPTIEMKLTDLIGKDDNTVQQQNQSTEHLEMMRKRAAAAEAMAARERKKLQELQEKKKAEAAQKEEERRLESERLLKEKKMREEMIRQQERAKREEEDKKQQQQMQEEQREKQLQIMHLIAIRSQMQHQLAKALLNEVVQKEAKNIVMKNIETKLYIKHITKLWLFRARAKVQKRVVHAMERKSRWEWNMHMVCDNPYIPSDDTIYKATPAHSMPEGIKDRVNQSILAEKIALENNPSNVDQESVWKSEEFSLSIYPRIKDKVFDLKKSRAKHGESQKPNWQLLISAPDSECDSSVWFRRKFDLDNTFLRNDALYQAFNITTRMNTPEMDVSCQVAEEVGAIIFSLPESKADKNPEEFASYWKENKKRLDKLIENFRYYNPGMRVPVLFTYFPDSSSTESTLEKLPQLLELDTKRLISDYHILVMNPLTISNRLQQEVNWLSNNTIINQQ